MADPTAVLDDLVAESMDLDRFAAELPPPGWATVTPAPGWTIAHQIAHLVWTDEQALLSMTDPEAFAQAAREALAAPQAFVDQAARQGARLAPTALLGRWRDSRQAVQEALRSAPPGARFPWFGPPMSAASMATGRLMETWAHGQDVVDALGAHREPTARLRHIARIGFHARDYAYQAHELKVPEEPFHLALIAPDGEVWTFGPGAATQRVTGPAVDFCLLVTQRRHRADTALKAEGSDADQWLDVAQAFAGPPGAGRQPGQFG